MWVGQFPSTCGITRLRPPWRLGTSLRLTRVVEAYRSWKLLGKGGSEESLAGECLAMFAVAFSRRGLLTRWEDASSSVSDLTLVSESESGYVTRAIYPSTESICHQFSCGF